VRRIFVHVRNKLLNWVFIAGLPWLTMPAGSAQGNHTTVHTVEDFDVVVPAAFTCTGEAVHVYGPINETIQTTLNSSGGATVVLHFTPHLQAVGVDSGNSYIAVGPSTEVTHTGPAGATVTTFVNITRLIAPGSAPDLRFDEMMHITVNANGVTTVTFDNVRTSCAG
jgi:hypothetical protein